MKRNADWRNGDTGMKIIKCACGLILRNKNWADHWYVCGHGSSVPVDAQDAKDLEYHELTSPFGAANRDRKFQQMDDN